MTPVEHLLARGGREPDELAARIGLNDWSGVMVRPAPGWMRAMWRGPVGAMTLGSTIYVRPDLLGGDPQRLASLLAHEAVHVRQWRQLGRVGFLRRYLGEYFSNRRRRLGHDESYSRISFEEEARQLSRPV